MKIWNIVAIALLCGVVVGCKNEVQQTAGEYSYKISGSVLVDSVEQRLSNETGVVYVVEKEKETLLLTFNMLGGDVYTTTATIKNKVLEMAELERIVSQSARDYKVTVSGRGDVYDKNILLRLQYKGTSMDKDSIALESKDIQLLATRN